MKFKVGDRIRFKSRYSKIGTVTSSPYKDLDDNLKRNEYIDVQWDDNIKDGLVAMLKTDNLTKIETPDTIFKELLK